MRFLIAAVIFSQAMPVSSIERKQLRTSVDLKSHSHTNFMTRRSLGRRSMGAARRLSRTVGILKNELARQSEATAECNPSSTDPDTGILSCGAGYNCVATSLHSRLGGVCMPGARGRKLMYQSYLPCTPNSSFPMECDCSNFNATSFTGRLQCSSGFPYACLAGTDYCYSYNATYIFQNLSAVSTTVCHDFKKPYAVNICYQASFGVNASTTLEVNGTNCISYVTDFCTGCSSFDCTNIPKGVAGDSCNGSFPLPIVKGFFDALNASFGLNYSIPWNFSIPWNYSLPFNDSFPWNISFPLNDSFPRNSE